LAPVVPASLEAARALKRATHDSAATASGWARAQEARVAQQQAQAPAAARSLARELCRLVDLLQSGGATR